MLQVDVTQIVVHEAHDPNSLADLLAPTLPQTTADWSQPRRIALDNYTAQYAITRNYNGTPTIYIISFVLDENGNWVIDSM